MAERYFVGDLHCVIAGCATSVAASSLVLPVGPLVAKLGGLIVVIGYACVVDGK